MNTALWIAIVLLGIQAPMPRAHQAQRLPSQPQSSRLFQSLPAAQPLMGQAFEQRAAEARSLSQSA